MEIGALVLAAGAARRFGSDKRQARLGNGQTLLETCVAACQRVHGNCTVVLDEADVGLRGQLLEGGAAVVSVASRGPGQGMGDSLAAGIHALQAGTCEAAVISLGDMPWIRDETRSAVVEALGQHPLVVPAFAGQRGHPVGFQRQFFAELGALTGDSGARSLLRRHGALCHELVVGDPGVLRDVDTPADLH